MKPAPIPPSDKKHRGDALNFRVRHSDVDFDEAAADHTCVDRLVDIAERSATGTEDGMNATEASEERIAAAEGHAMR
jgi:hypothetical protein